MKIAVLGLGLIGGSMAKDLRKSGLAESLIGADDNEQNAAKALEIGLVDEIYDISKITAADVILIAVPVSVINNLLPALLDKITEDTVVIDTGSTKSSICKALKNHVKRPLFVAAHPIAGTENSGPEAALEGLFRNKTNIVCERNKSSEKAMLVATKVFNALGMNTIYMEAEEHDKHVAYVSHLSHVSSFLLGQTVLDIEKNEKNIFDLAGSGFASTVRLAKSSPEMWAPIFEQNAEYLGQAIQEYIMHLQKFQYHLMKRNISELSNIMKEANHIREVLAGIEFRQNKE